MVKRVIFEMKPGIPKRQLLLVAAAVWLFAGGFLLFRGITMLPEMSMLWLKIVLAVIAGLIFFHLLFLRVSLKHITRIRSLEILRPCVFSFFDWKSYLLMAIMITSGVLVRKTGLIDQKWISLFFITMATPLLLSAVRFLRAWGKYCELVKE
ncbi:MAG: hypothetical protein IH596_06080 [Bacteroidales bacterium]|nr:hypothetical protein [Bacteroidales bacterium]